MILKYQLKRIVINPYEEFYPSDFELLDEVEMDVVGDVDIGVLSNINNIIPSENLKTKIIPKPTYDLIGGNYSFYNSEYSKITHDLNYIKVDSLQKFINYQLIWKKY